MLMSHLDLRLPYNYTFSTEEVSINLGIDKDVAKGILDELNGVVSAGKTLELDSVRMANAFGIAGANTTVPSTKKWEFGRHSMTKYNNWAGWMAHLATISVLAAENGYTGDKDILDGEWGFWTNSD